MPSVFPNLPSYLTVHLPPPRASTSSAEQRLERVEEQKIKLEREKAEKDKVKSFDHLKNNLHFIDISPSVQVCSKSDSISFVKFTDDSPMKIEYYLTVSETLNYQMCVQNVLISNERVAHLTGDLIETFSCVPQIILLLADLVVKNQDFLKDISSSLFECAQKEENPLLQKKLLFLSEQLSLALVPKMARKYSSDLLAASLMWKTTSSSLYRQLQNEDCLTLPNFKHLTSLSRALTTETGLSESTVSYLNARIAKLSERERLVVLMLDEIYCSERAEYARGTFYGASSGVCKTMLSFMIKSVAGNYSDIVALFPVKNLDSTRILKDFHTVITTLTDIGYHVFDLSVDNASPNRKFYIDELCAGSLSTKIPHPSIENEYLFLLFDSVHNFKNVYNNFVNRKEFVFPTIKGNEPEQRAKYAHLEQMYNLELGKPLKLAYKLNDKVLHPSNIEKTNVQLADNLFHESTINGLRYYAGKGNSEWNATADFLEVIRNWWNILNVKHPMLGIKKRNKYMKPVTINDKTNLDFLKTFSRWLERWRCMSKERGAKSCLTDETFLATIQTTKTSVEVAEELLQRDDMNFVLLGFLQSDPIERRFGWYRQLAGGNYFISIRQILEAEKSIRLKSLLKFSGLSMTEVKEAFKDGSNRQTEATNTQTNELLQLLDHDCLDFSNIQVEDANIIFYISGCFARSLCKEQTCDMCVKLLKKSDDVPNIIFMQEHEVQYQAERQQFIDQVNRGGLCFPTDLTYVACLHAWNFFHDIQSQKDAYNFLLSSTEPRKVFTQAFLTICSNTTETQSIICQHCENGHDFSELFERLAIKMFNTFAKNICAERNSEIHKGKKRGIKSGDGRKVKKLQSN